MEYYIDILRNKYIEFDGRAPRAEYWYFVLFNFIVSIIISIISAVVGDRHDILSVIYGLAVFLPAIGVSIRRMHDIGKSGWWILISLIPLIGWIWWIVLAVQDSEPGPNMYGANPKGSGPSDEPTIVADEE